MAGDWIKMRVWLKRDPKVLRMADILSCDRAFMDWMTDPVQRSCKSNVTEHVTRNVTAALCVTGLLQVWGAAREQGIRNGDDLVVQHCDLSILDEIAEIPSFGYAMSQIGWAIESDSDSVIFPKFFADKQAPSDRYRDSNAARQAKYREARKAKSNVTSNGESNVTRNVTSNVTVTHREEKRREEINTPLNPPLKGGTTISNSRKSKRPPKPDPLEETIAEHKAMHLEKSK